MLSLNGATRIHVTIGDPIAQVKSPAGVTQGFAARGADAIVIPLQVKPADIEDFFRLAKKLPNLDGIIITVPHKPLAFRHCDGTSERSRVLEVANVMRRGADNRWSGDMTDGGGFVAALKRNGFDPKDKRALQVGAGGAGSAIALRSEEHTSELQSRSDLVCRLLLEKKKTTNIERPAVIRVCMIANKRGRSSSSGGEASSNSPESPPAAPANISAVHRMHSRRS